MKLRQSLRNKTKLSATLKSWLPILQTGLVDLEEKLAEYSDANPFVDVDSNIQKNFTTYNSKIPKPFRAQYSKNSVGNTIEALNFSEQSLYDVLYEQIGAPLFPTDRSQRVAHQIVTQLNEEGFYEGNDETVALRADVTLDEVERIRKRFAYLSPAGIGAKNMQESLLFQLETLDIDAGLYALVAEMIHHMETMSKFKKKKRFSEAFKIIQSFRVPPAIEFFAKELEVIPDIFVFDNDNHIEVTLNDKFYPMIHIDSSQIEEKSDFVKAKIKEAKDLVDALEMRKATLHKIGLMIVEYQYDFFLGGEMKPMKLKDLAEEFGHAPSTISRAISGKYLECNRGTISLKSFFNTAVDEDVSNATIKDYIENIVKVENRNKPLSDIRILELVEERFSVKMVRRTITKYRKQLNIASSSERKKLYELTI
jgi:RNA polymerase sigma-54 factor